MNNFNSPAIMKPRFRNTLTAFVILTAGALVFFAVRHQKERKHPEPVIVQKKGNGGYIHIGASKESIADSLKTQMKLLPNSEKLSPNFEVFSAQHTSSHLEFTFINGKCVRYLVGNLTDVHDAYAVLDRYGQGLEWRTLNTKSAPGKLPGSIVTKEQYMRSDGYISAMISSSAMAHDGKTYSSAAIIFESAEYGDEVKKHTKLDVAKKLDDARIRTEGL